MTAAYAPQVDRFTGPFPGQQYKFFQRTERIVFYGGAGGGGKSICGMAKFGQQLAVERGRITAGEITASRAWGLYLRRNTTDLKQAIDKSEELFTDIDPDAEFNVNSHLWTFPNYGNAKFEFGHMEHERSKYKYKSNAYTYVFVDELTEFTETQFDYIDTRLRTTDPVLEQMLQVCAGSNPDGAGLLWVRDRFIDGKEPEVVYRIETRTSSGKVINYDQVFIPAKLKDNPVLYESGQYEASLLNKRPEVREAILEGNWWITPGAFLANAWDTRFHVCPNHEVPRNAYVCRSGDFGILAPSSITWWYVDREGAFTAFHNLYVRNHDAVMLAGKISEIEQHYGFWDEENNCSRLTGPLDEDCFNRASNGGPSIAEAMRRNGVRWRRSRKDRFNGAAEIVSRLLARIPGATEDEEDRPMLRWMERCVSPIKTIPVLRVDPNDPNDVDTKGEDHCWDDTMYMCLWRPMKGRSENDNADEDEDDVVVEFSEHRRRANGGRLGVPPGGW